MSKGLDALERIKNEKTQYFSTLYDSDMWEEDLDLVEKELKEKEQQDSVIKVLKEVIEFSQMLAHIEPNKDNGFDFVSAVGINIQRDIENRERELLRQWVLDTCFPKELKRLKELEEEKQSFDRVIEKKLKVLEIIIKKGVAVGTLQLKEVGLQEYNDFIGDKELYLTQEEYELLKEVLL